MRAMGVEEKGLGGWRRVRVGNRHGLAGGRGGLLGAVSRGSDHALDAIGDLGVLSEEQLGVLAALAEARVVEGVE